MSAMMTDSMLFAFPEYLEARRPIAKMPSFDGSNLSDMSNSRFSTISGKSNKSSRSSKSSISSAEARYQPTLTKIGNASTGISHSDALHTSGYSYGYGYELPQYASETIWWDDKRIEETVTKGFLTEKIPNIPGAGLRRKLHKPMSFGDGLTDATYCDWVLEKAQKFFLILLEMGIPEQIFGIVDDSWEDDDLPLPLESVHRLKLAFPRDPVVENRFYKKQYCFLLKEISKHTHVDYDSDDVVPLETGHKRSGVTLYQAAEDRVTLPDKKSKMYLRRRIPLGDGPGLLCDETFKSEIERMKSIKHPHIVEVFASYTFQNTGYVLQAPACDNTLRGFLQSPNTPFKNLNREQKRRQLLVWSHCLADALSFLNDSGIKHEDIRPRSIVLDGMSVFFACIGNSRRLDPTPRKIGGDAIETERYEYGAPELWGRTPLTPLTPTFPTLSHLSTSIAPISIPSTPRSVPIPPSPNGYSLPPSLPRSTSSHSISSVGSTGSTFTGFPSPTTSFKSQSNDWGMRSSAPNKAAVFSLAAVFLDIMTFCMKRKPTTFAHHRSSRKRRTSTSRGGQPDASFHANLPQVMSWIDVIDKDATKTKDGEDKAVRQVLQLCKDMLHQDPIDRPGTTEVADRMWMIVKGEGGMPHCGNAARAPAKDQLEEMALMGRHDRRWDWPWEEEECGGSACASGSARAGEKGIPIRSEAVPEEW